MRLRFRCPVPLLLLCASISAAFAQNASAQPPSEYAAYYWIHETPTDPDSPVTVKIKLALTPEATDGNSVGWGIASIEITRVSTNNSETIWTDSAPEIPSPDGLWWVMHADVSKPQPGEFVLPPHLSGTATTNPSGIDLDYDFEGVTCDPKSMPPYTATAWLTHSFKLQGEVNPFEEGTGDPTESDPTHDS